MQEAVVSQEDPHMSDEIFAVVRPDEKDQIAPFQRVKVRDDPAIPGLLLRASGQFYPVCGKGGISQTGTIHAPGCDSTHAVRSTQVFFRRADHLVGSDTMGIQRFSGTTADKSLSLRIGNHR